MRSLECRLDELIELSFMYRIVVVDVSVFVLAVLCHE